MGKAKVNKDKPTEKIKTAGIKFNKDKGQHILRNPLIIQTMIEKAGIKSSDSVLEVGPGTGNLTVKLLEKAGIVHAFEIDPRMVSELQKRVQTSPNRPKLHICVGDAIKCKEWPRFDLCVANLPYQISSPFVLRLIAYGNSYRCAVVMVQKEFADRLVAKPGDKLYCRLSANIQFHCRVAKLMKIARNSFRPPPKVDSAVVRIEPRFPKPPVSFEEWDSLLRIVFARKNKTLSANFSKSVVQILHNNYLKTCKQKNIQPQPEGIEQAANLMNDKVTKILTDSSFGTFRARTMDEDDLLKLLLAFKTENIYFA
ncbi:dimethyladenosine transferase [Cichlidogyrus casuarinus]|uniref:rRNA adenine N(6)-methyltransferase n=1 Tax=Cichlidogyrus casuarinus TaxID=1844966 RepID=A0ABD2PZ68_9PLAT